MTPPPLASLITVAAMCLLVPSCGKPAESETQTISDPGPQLTVVEGLETVELIDLLAHPNELTRTRAHQELHRHLIVETEVVDYPERLTRFHKFAPHACKDDHEAQTLHILGLFAAQEDITSILLLQCLGSKHDRVRATALEVAHFSDNRIDAALLAFDPEPATLASYKIALRNLGTAEARERLAELGDG